MSIQVASFLAPKNGNTWYVLEDKFIKGGLQIVADQTARNAINPLNLKEGSLVLVLADNIVYQLAADLVTWNQFTGLTGAMGPTGPAGADGATGAQGPQGLTGAQGPQGIQGDTGATGPQGPQGDVGPQGIQGVQGPAGADGAVGAQGPQGIQGPQGVDGKTAYEVAVAAGFVGTQAAWLLSLKGADGAVGPQGIQGPQGDTGPQGLKGDKGDTGTNGTNGVDGAVGTQGIQGIKGDTGAAGTNGTNGVDGKSAYEVAVAGGFVGTQAAWLLSLKGADGAVGPQGPQGEVGPQGPVGPTPDMNLVTLNLPYDISLYVAGFADTATLTYSAFLATRQIDLLSGLAGSLGVSKGTLTAATSFDLNVNGVKKGSVNFAAGTNVAATFTWASNVKLVAGDLLELVTTATPSGQISDVVITLVGRAAAPNGTMLA